MARSLVGLSIALLIITPAASAQSTSGDTGNDGTDGGNLADNRPSENVRGGAVRERAPGRTIDAARARHRDLSEARLAAQRSGETSSLAAEPAAGTSSGSLGDLLGGSLGGLINTFLGSGLSGGLGSMFGATSGAGQTSGTGTTSGSGSDFSNLPPEVIQMLQGAGISLSDLNQKSLQSATPGSETSSSKTSLRTQTNDGQQERDFRVRWADAMLSTLFTSLAVGLQTQDFIDVLKDFFRPLFTPPATDSDAGDGTPTGDGGSDGDGSGSGGDGGDSGDDGGGDEPLI